jgi:hypothetical protein
MMFRLGISAAVCGIFPGAAEKPAAQPQLIPNLPARAPRCCKKPKRPVPAQKGFWRFHEAELKRVTEEYEQRRELYYQGLISRVDVIQAEERVAKTTLLIRDDKRFLAETDTALTEFTMRDELLRLPGWLSAAIAKLLVCCASMVRPDLRWLRLPRSKDFLLALLAAVCRSVLSVRHRPTTA